MSLRKNLRRYVARTPLQAPFRLLYRIALIGMNYGGAGSHRSAGDEQALHLLRAQRDPLVVFDVGANIGSYVAQVIKHAPPATTVHAFEPSAAAFARLQAHVGALPNVHLHRLGIGAARGESVLFAASPGSVLATTFVNPLDGATPGEPIEMTTVDDFCAAHGIARIDLLKLDLEGGELDALKGARRLLDAGAIRMIQFEFGEPSIAARTYFLDLFQALAPRYDVFRVLPHGLARIASYDASLEVFMSTNYLAIVRS